MKLMVRPFKEYCPDLQIDVENINAKTYFSAFILDFLDINFINIVWSYKNNVNCWVPCGISIFNKLPL